MVKEAEGTSQRTCVNEAWTWTKERGLTVGWVEGGKKEKKWENCNRINKQTNKDHGL